MSLRCEDFSFFFRTATYRMSKLGAEPVRPLFSGYHGEDSWIPLKPDPGRRLSSLEAGRNGTGFTLKVTTRSPEVVEGRTWLER